MVFAPPSLYYFIFNLILQWCFAVVSWTTCDETFKQVQTRAATFCDFHLFVHLFLFKQSWDVAVTQTQHTPLFSSFTRGVCPPEATAENRKASPFIKQLSSQCFIVHLWIWQDFTFAEKKKKNTHWTTECNTPLYDPAFSFLACFILL